MEDNKWVFSVEYGAEKNPEDDDTIYFDFEVDCRTIPTMIVVRKNDFYVISTPFSTDCMEKYQDLLELVNEYNALKAYTTSYITKDDEKCVTVQCSHARPYDENSTPDDAMKLLSMVVSISDDLYMQIMKELA